MGPSGRIAWVPILLGAWAIYEIGSAILDAYTTASTLLDPCASFEDKAVTSGLFVLGAAAPGGGYATIGKQALSQYGKRRLAKDLAGIPRSAQPVAQGGSAKIGRWWEYQDASGKLRIVVEHSDSTVHVGTPKAGSPHRSGGPPRYFDDGFGRVGEWGPYK